MKKITIYLFMLTLTLAGCSNNTNKTSPSFSSVPTTVATSETFLPKTENTVSDKNTPLSLFIGFDSQYIKEYDGGDRHYAYWEQLVLDDSCKKQYPALVKSIDEYNGKIEKTGKEYAEKTIPEYLEDLAPSDTMPLSCSLKMTVQRADNSVLSVLTEEYSFLGGPHPNYIFDSANFDVQSGKLLTIDDVVTDKKAFSQLVINNIKAKYPDGLFDDWQTTVNDGISNNKVAWIMENNSMVIWFSPYDLAPYAAGTLTVEIPYNELFKEQYTKSLTNSVMPIRLYQTTIIGKDSLTVTPYKNEHEIYESIEIGYNDKELLLVDCYTYQPEVYLVSFNSGKKYLYVHTVSEDGLQQLIICDLNGDSLLEAGPRLMNTGFRRKSINTTDELKEVFVNPDSFIITKHSNKYGHENYIAHVDEKTGLPVLENKIVE